MFDKDTEVQKDPCYGLVWNPETHNVSACYHKAKNTEFMAKEMTPEQVSACKVFAVAFGQEWGTKEEIESAIDAKIAELKVVEK